MTTRRTFLAATAVTISSAAKGLDTIGVQLYTVRGILPDKPLATLKQLEKIGYRECEVVARDMDYIWASLKQTALKPVSLHLDTQLFMKDQARLPAAIEDAAKRGFQYIICPYVAPVDRGGSEVMKRLGATLNTAGEKAKAEGLTLAYHNHAFEFAPAGSSGTLLDVLLASADPKLVQLELDIMWVQVAGADPLEMLRKYKGRIPLMHIKNIHEGVHQRYDEQIPRTAFAEAGKGVINIPPVLTAANAAGVKHFFVEQDETPGDPIASLRESYNYIRGLSL